jgi:hypothetical protein
LECVASAAEATWAKAQERGSALFPFFCCFMGFLQLFFHWFGFRGFLTGLHVYRFGFSESSLNDFWI